MRNLFGTDGVRGVANRYLTPEMAFGIGRCSAHILKNNHPAPFIVVGRDTRKSGDMLEGALIAGICSSGMDVYTLGVVSTPALAYITRELGAVAGIMISASHNPIEDNGLKIFGPCGYKLSDSLETKLEETYFGEDSMPRPIGAEVGRVYSNGGTVKKYVDYMKKTGPALNGMHVALDCGHGSVYRLAPEIFRALGARVTVLNAEPDGININVNCGSTNPGQLQQVVKNSDVLLGMAFDGDADRLIAVDEKGDLIDGDLLMLIFTLYLKKKDKLRHNTLVATVMSNGALDAAAGQNNFRVIRTAVGDRYVLEKMLEGDFNLGGEQSGHIIFSEHSTTGDGLLTALELARVVSEEQKLPSAYQALFNRLPQITVNCRVARKNGWENLPRFKEAMTAAKEQLGPFGRILVRPSGTEPLMRVMVEGEINENELNKMAGDLAEILVSELN